MHDDFIGVITGRQACRKHGADIEEACWYVETATGRTLSAVCGKRAKKAGFVGAISRKSMGL